MMLFISIKCVSHSRLMGTKMLGIFVFSLFLVFVCGGKHDIYSGFEVHGLSLRDRSDMELLHSLETQYDLDVWQHGAAGQRDALVMVSPEQRDGFLRTLDDSGVDHYLHVADVAKDLEAHDIEIANYRRSRSGRILPFEDYPRFAEVDAYLESVAALYPNLATVETAGPSYENRTIKYLKISTSNFEESNKPIYFLDAMIHAREWVTTPASLYAIHRLVEDLRTEDQDLLELFDWIILPIVNPDGYEYTHTDERLWRRTRSNNPPEVDTTCLGVDANRNFDVAFNTVGVSSNPCSQTYPGTLAFSEPETQYVRDILHEYVDRIQLYLNIHSHGNYVLFGFGNHSLPANGAALHLVGATLGAAIDSAKLPEAPYYLVGNSANLLYATSGSAQDYAQHIGIPFSYTLEMPGLGYDFRVPPQFIEQINSETWKGIAASARAARPYYEL